MTSNNRERVRRILVVVAVLVSAAAVVYVFMPFEATGGQTEVPGIGVVRGGETPCGAPIIEGWGPGNDDVAIEVSDLAQPIAPVRFSPCYPASHSRLIRAGLAVGVAIALTVIAMVLGRRPRLPLAAMSSAPDVRLS